MKELIYVIMAIGKNGKKIYLAIDEEKSNNKYNKAYFKWTSNIEEAYADFNAYDLEQFAKSYFTYFDKWYIGCYYATFE